MFKKIFLFVLFCLLNLQLTCFASAEDEEAQARHLLTNVDSNYCFEFALSHLLESNVNVYTHVIDFITSHEPVNYGDLEPLLRREFGRMRLRNYDDGTQITAVIIVRGADAVRPIRRENAAYLYSIEIFANEGRSAFLEISFFQDIYFGSPPYRYLYLDPNAVVQVDSTSSSDDWISESETEEDEKDEVSSIDLNSDGENCLNQMASAPILSDISIQRRMIFDRLFELSSL